MNLRLWLLADFFLYLDLEARDDDTTALFDPDGPGTGGPSENDPVLVAQCESPRR